jgi:hypothetical protein
MMPANKPLKRTVGRRRPLLTANPMKGIVATLLLCSISAPAMAQSAKTGRTLAWRPSYEFGVGYPHWVSGGVSAVIGFYTSGSIRTAHLQGVYGAIDVGIGGLVARGGWTKLMEHDAGVEGFSIEAVYLRPHGVWSGLERGENCVGPGFTYHFGYMRVSGAVVIVLAGPNARQVVPTASLTIAMPLRKLTSNTALHPSALGAVVKRGG